MLHAEEEQTKGRKMIQQAKPNLDKLREKLNKLQRKDKTKKDFGPSVFFFPEDTGETNEPYLFRLLPWADQPDMPIKELEFYYGVRPIEEVRGKKQKIKAPMSLRQFGEKDPIQEAIDNLRKKDGKEPDEVKSDEEMAKKLYPTKCYYFVGLLRGKEHEGPKVWQTQSKKIYEKIIKSLMNTSKWGNLMDLDEGRDMEIYFDKNKERDKTDIDWASTTTKAWEDDKQLEEWLTVEKQPDLDKLFAKRKKSYSELKSIFETWLGEGLADDDDEESSDDEVQEEQVSSSKPVEVERKVVKETPKKKSAREAFADLSDDDED